MPLPKKQALKTKDLRHQRKIRTNRTERSTEKNSKTTKQVMRCMIDEPKEARLEIKATFMLIRMQKKMDIPT